MNVTLKRRSSREIVATEISTLADKLSLHPKIVEVLISRGIDSEDEIRKFLEPDVNNFCDPFSMKGMKAAVKRLEAAIDGDETVVVYGDYDADGICAAAILSLYLRSRGLNVYTHIPNRIGDGYGLSVSSLEKIIESVCPDLILTCDCGISGYAEVEYAFDLGVDMIVTDHHEVSDKIPECIVVNPKQSDCDYPCKFLCGAGVALKLVEAMGGRETMGEYLDLACVATIADLVPLLGENRLIVQLGLKTLSEGKNVGLMRLLRNQSLGRGITSSDIAFKIAPRINAAGRIGDAYRAFEMLISDDVDEIEKIIDEINEANGKRKLACDKFYDEAVEDLKYEDLVNSRCIVLSHPEWEKGITGIVAARLTGDFKRPSFIMVPSGDGYFKGTCRSIEGINIYEALSAVSDILVEFGGHSQAAGFSIEEKNVPEFKRRISEYLLSFDIDLFLPNCVYDVEMAPEGIDLSFIKELDKLEPTGNSFTRPLFKITASDLSVALCKSNINHTTITTKSGLQIFAFNFYNRLHYAMGEGNKEMIVELQVNSFGGREYPRGILREIAPDNLYINNETARAVYVNYSEFCMEEDGAVYSEYAKADLASLVGSSPFGTLVVAFDRLNYDEFVSQCGSCGVVIFDYMFPSVKNNYSRLIVAPDFKSDIMLSSYDRIIFMDKPITDGLIAFLNKNTKAEIFVPKEDGRARFIGGLDVSRLTLGKYYDYIRKNSDIYASNMFSYMKSMKNRISEIDLSELTLAIRTFSELGLIREESGKYRLSIVKGEKRELSQSKILQQVERIGSLV